MRNLWIGGDQATAQFADSVLTMTNNATINAPSTGDEMFVGSRGSNGTLNMSDTSSITHAFNIVVGRDGDEVRRDLPTLWKKLGVPNAINVADYLISKAYQLILGSPLPAETNIALAAVFSSTFERTVEGQALDINLRGSPEVTLETYMRIVQLKTAYYLALGACAVIAVVYPFSTSAPLSQKFATGLVNLVLGRRAVPELIQGEANPERIAAEAARLLTDAEARNAMRRDLDEVRGRLGEGGAIAAPAETPQGRSKCRVTLAQFG